MSEAKMEKPKAGSGEESRMRLYFGDRSNDFELLRTVGYAPYDGAEVGECIAAAGRIQEGDDESWWREWKETADRVRALGEDSARSGHAASAREAYLRASNYYRTSEFYLREDPGHDPRVIETSQMAVSCFEEAAKLFTPPDSPLWEPVEIPYEDTVLPAHFYQPGDTKDTDGTDGTGDAKEPRPTLIFFGGFDSTLEELYFAGAAAAVRRGYNCLTFAGPGQGRLLREEGLSFRPDWEAVVRPAVDFALSRPEVDAERLALMGMSMGGLFAPRAAAFEPRVSALICFDGVYELAVSQVGGFPEFLAKWVSEGQAELADPVIRLLMGANTYLRWAVNNGVWALGATGPTDLLLKLREYTLEGVADKISCPTLVCKAENDLAFTGQPERLYEELRCPKEFMVFTEQEGAGEHCHAGAISLFHQKAFNWLDEVFAT